MKLANLAIKLLGSLMLLGIILTLGDNALMYFGHGGLKGSVSSIIFAGVGYTIALIFTGFLAVQLWKLKL